MNAANRTALARLAKLFVDAGVVALVIVVLVYTLGALGAAMDGPDDIQAAQDTEAALQDAIAQAQAERPDLWTAETKERARIAARLVAQGVQP